MPYICYFFKFYENLTYPFFRRKTSSNGPKFRPLHCGGKIVRVMSLKISSRIALFSFVERDEVINELGLRLGVGFYNDQHTL